LNNLALFALEQSARAVTRKVLQQLSSFTLMPKLFSHNRSFIFSIKHKDQYSTSFNNIIA